MTLFLLVSNLSQQKAGCRFTPRSFLPTQLAVWRSPVLLEQFEAAHPACWRDRESGRLELHAGQPASLPFLPLSDRNLSSASDTPGGPKGFLLPDPRES